jgi:predicted ABC-type ATPase
MPNLEELQLAHDNLHKAYPEPDGAVVEAHHILAHQMDELGHTHPDEGVWTETAVEINRTPVSVGDEIDLDLPEEVLEDLHKAITQDSDVVLYMTAYGHQLRVEPVDKGLEITEELTDKQMQALFSTNKAVLHEHGETLVPEEQALHDALLSVTNEYGKFNQDMTGVWAGYDSARNNKQASMGVNCQNCALYAGDGVCTIISLPVEPMGKCRFAIIPDYLIVTPDKQPELANKAVDMAEIDDQNRFTLGPWYIPDMLDAHEEWTDAQTLQEAAWGYVRGGDRAIRLQHNRDIVAGEWVEIMQMPFPITAPITAPDGTDTEHTYPAGTVFLGVIWEPWAWELVKAGELRGYSVGGKAERILADINEDAVGKALEDVLKHPGHPDQKVHGRKGITSSSAETALFGDNKNGLAHARIPKREIKLEYSDGYDRGLQALNDSKAGGDIQTQITEAKSIFRDEVALLQVEPPRTTAGEVLAANAVNLSGFVDGASGTKRRYRQPMFGGDILGRYTLSTADIQKHGDPSRPNYAAQHPNSPALASGGGYKAKPAGGKGGTVPISDADFKALGNPETSYCGKFVIGQNPDGSPIFTPERQALHDKIVAEALADGKTTDNPEFLLMGGGSGAGKSTILKAGNGKKKIRGGKIPEAVVDKPENAVTIDPDAVKTKLPEYQVATQSGNTGDWKPAAHLSHEESSYIAKRIQAGALDMQTNVVLDGTGDSSQKSLLGKVATARSRGYTVRGVYVSCPTRTAVTRAKRRAEQTKRYVPEFVIERIHREVSNLVPDVADQFDSFELWDTSGGKPIRTASTTFGKPITVHSAYRWGQFVDKARKGTVSKAILDPMGVKRLGRICIFIASGLTKKDFGALTEEESSAWDVLVEEIAQMDADGYGIEVPSEWEDIEMGEVTKHGDPSRPNYGSQHPSSISGRSKASQTSKRPYSPAALRAAINLVARGKAVEPAVTKEMTDLASKNGGEMVGLSNRMKGEDSLAGKIQSDATKEHGGNVDAAAAKISDSVRYTMSFPAETYTAGVQNTLAELESKGYTARTKNFWVKGDPYNGINVALTSPDGFPVELQFHTPETLRTKTRTHADYEQYRNPKAPLETKRFLYDKMAGVADAIKFPTGALLSIGEPKIQPRP